MLMLYDVLLIVVVHWPWISETVCPMNFLETLPLSFNIFCPEQPCPKSTVNGRATHERHTTRKTGRILEDTRLNTLLLVMCDSWPFTKAAVSHWDSNGCQVTPNFLLRYTTGRLIFLQSMITSGAWGAEQNSFLNNRQTWVWAAGRLAVETLLNSLHLQNFTSHLHAVFTEWLVHSIKVACSQIWLIWGQPWRVPSAEWRVSNLGAKLRLRNSPANVTNFGVCLETK